MELARWSAPIARLSLTLACVLTPAALAAHQLPDAEGTGPYEGQRVVRVSPANEAQRQAALALGAECLACTPARTGPLDLLVTGEQTQALRELGLEPVVVVDDVQGAIDAQRAQIEAIRNARVTRDFVLGDETYYQTYHPLADIHARMDQLAGARPDLARVEQLGASYEGRDIPAIVISGPGDASNRPVIIWQGTQHAREWVSPATVMYLAEFLIDGYDDDPRVRSLVANIEFWIIPVVNPDGYNFTWVQSRLWRKNRRDNSEYDQPGRGVDLNRNWGYEWGGSGAETSGGGFTYRGPFAFSEPETQRVRDLALSLEGRVAGFIDYHSYSQLILLPWGYSTLAAPAPDDDFFDDLGRDMSQAIRNETNAFYNWGPSGATLYLASGVAPDWFYGELGASAMTIELRDRSTFLLPPELILPCARENFEAALLFAERSVGPLPTADLNDDGQFNNSDINLFIARFTSENPSADLNGDGAFTNTDINRFISFFLSGI